MTTPDRAARVVHTGANHTLLIARRIRALLWRGLVEIANDEEAMDELFGGPELLDEPYLEEHAAAAKEYMRGTVRGDAERRVWVGASYPVGDARMPWIGVVTESGGENPGEAVMADRLHATHQKLGRDTAVLEGGTRQDFDVGDDLPTGTTDVEFAPVVERVVRGIGTTEQVQITIWHPVTEIAELLDAACKRALFLGKQRLADVGGLSLDLSWTGVQPDQRLYPRIAWVPTIRVTVHSHLTYTANEGRKPTGIRIRGGSYGS